MRLKSFIAGLLCLSFILLTGGTFAAEKPETEEEIKLAASYDDILSALKAARSRFAYEGKGMATADVAVPADVAAPAPEASQAPVGGRDDYSQTNVQVEGIDEGDIVKTDGRYIYVLRNDELVILEALGGKPVKLSAIKLFDTPQNDTIHFNEYATDLYISGDVAAVVSSFYSYTVYYRDDVIAWEKGVETSAPPESFASGSGTSSSEVEPSKAKAPVATKAAPAVKADPVEAERIAADVAILPYPSGKTVTKVTLYDISNRSAPKRSTVLAQDGSLLSSRLLSGTLYLVSNYSMYSFDERTPETFVPSVYQDGEKRLVAPGEIGIMPIIPSTQYTVVCAYDLESGALSATRSVLGGGSTIYMNADALYVAGTQYVEEQSAPYRYSVYTVTDYASSNRTDIVRFDLAEGGLEIAASGSVNGSLYGQFALDAYENALRVVTTQFTSRWSVYVDEEMGFTNYKWHDNGTHNNLYVLDENLNVMGSVTDLAPGEQVYSVRFDGPIGYITTFERVDPLFAVDLSDPANPQVLSALKIPGFSQYMHVFGENRLFGLGMDADPETGRTTGMKLVMFDTTDKTDVTVYHELLLGDRYSPALYNHKAILISPAKKLIGFPVDNGYAFYGYDDTTGFYRLLQTDSAQWTYNSRGLYIGDYVYIVSSDDVSVFNIHTFTFVGRVTF
ncbi:MAG TPA: hypothetical protein GXZ77_05200 [Papillibacter sp.]|jgi:uncharacterized secreted protein with C-terminal beta-propeller domain|nr:hypothetical protein [Papillibacter sp.]